MIHISEQTITMTVRTAKEIMQKLVTCGLIDSDEATFSLKMSGRQDAEFIVPFPHNLDLIEPHPNDENGH
jgi:hypothetical protein